MLKLNYVSIGPSRFVIRVTAHTTEEVGPSRTRRWELRAPQPGGVQRFQHRPLAQAGHVSRLGFAQDCLDLVNREDHARQMLRPPGSVISEAGL